MNEHTGLEDFQDKAKEADEATDEATDEYTEAHESFQKTLISDLDDKIHENGLVELVSDSEGTTINTDKLVTWLEENYLLYPR
jgi:hypothetical protein